MQLLEAILLQAEVLELKAPRTGLAAGVVIESSMEKGRGAVVTALVKRGTLQDRRCDPRRLASSAACARCSMRTGSRSAEAPPSMPVVVLGLSGAPNAGDELLVVESERKAREVALYRQGKFRDVKLARAATACRGRVLADGRGQGRHHRGADQDRRAGQRRGAAAMR